MMRYGKGGALAFGVGVLLASSFGAAGAQMADPAGAAESREHVAQLDWLVGEWQGGGWMMMPATGRVEFTSSEVVESRLGGRLLVVEGLHRAADGEVVHHAMAAVTYDADDDAWVFHTWLGTQGDGGVDNPLELTERGFRWSPQGTQPNTTIVFDVVHENGEWIETGTVTLPDGRDFDFFQMRLRKVD